MTKHRSSQTRALLDWTGEMTAGASTSAAADHPCEWTDNGGCRADAVYFIQAGGLDSASAAVRDFNSCVDLTKRASDGSGAFGCTEGAPAFCAEKTPFTGTTICARPESIITSNNIQTLALANGTLAQDCPLERVLEGTARRACDSKYEALFEVSGCTSCMWDLRLFQGDVSSACADIKTYDECLSGDRKEQVDQMICRVSKPRLDVCNQGPGSDDGMSTGAIIGIIAAATIFVVAIALAACFLERRRKRLMKQRLASQEHSYKSSGPGQALFDPGNNMTYASTVSGQSSTPGASLFPQSHGNLHKVYSSGSYYQYSPAAPLVLPMNGGYEWNAAAAAGVNGGSPAERVKVTMLAGGPTMAANGTITSFTLDATSLASSLSMNASPAEVLEAQLDYAVMRQQGFLFDFLRLAPHLGRRVGGQGAVAFAQHKDSAAALYAIKFFFSSKAFEVELAAATDPVLRTLMPPVALIEDNPEVLQAATATMPQALAAHPLPPVIVTEKGESLDEFVARSAPDLFTSLQVMVHIARKLEQLHAAAWVHRDLKPGNAIWLPSSNSWTLIDFGICARAGTQADLNFSLYYAPPEVVTAYKNGEKDIVSDPAMDVWALGVVCWELLTKMKFYGVGVPADEVVAMLVGEEELPTERRMSEEAMQKLGKGSIRESVLSMLRRDPSQRPSIGELLQKWTKVFEQ